MRRKGVDASKTDTDGQMQTDTDRHRDTQTDSQAADVAAGKDMAKRRKHAPSLKSKGTIISNDRDFYTHTHTHTRTHTHAHTHTLSLSSLIDCFSHDSTKQQQQHKKKKRGRIACATRIVAMNAFLFGKRAKRTKHDFLPCFPPLFQKPETHNNHFV